MRIGIVSAQVPFVYGGAEAHAANLIKELRARGHEAELITLPFKWYPPQAIINSIAVARLTDLGEANGQPIDRIIGLKFPAYLVPHPDKILWILHQHRTAYELWDHPRFGDLINFPDGRAVRDAIHFADNTFIPQARAVYANSARVAERLRAANGIIASPLYHPPGNAELFRHDEADDYLFFPSRLTPLKRQDLVIEALRHCKNPVRVVFAGAAELPAYQASMQAQIQRYDLEDRVIWKGFTSEAEKLDLYARCLGVVYPPVDAGGPLEFVRHGETGFVSAADPLSLAEAMDRLWQDGPRARAMGLAGRAAYDELEISWEHVVSVLTAS